MCVKLRTKLTVGGLDAHLITHIIGQRRRHPLYQPAINNIITCHNTNIRKGKLDTCYSATYMSQTHDQQRFTISEVAADWHEVPYV